MCNFDVSRNSLIAECWAPVKVLDEVQDALRYGQVSSHFVHYLHKFFLVKLLKNNNYSEKGVTSLFLSEC